MIFIDKKKKKKRRISFPFYRCAKDIDTLIESLPNEDSSQELQTQSLRRLEVENQDAAKHLEEVILMIVIYLEIFKLYFM